MPEANRPRRQRGVDAQSFRPGVNEPGGGRCSVVEKLRVEGGWGFKVETWGCGLRGWKVRSGWRGKLGGPGVWRGMQMKQVQAAEEV